MLIVFLQNVWPYFLSSSIFSRPAFVHSTCGGLCLVYTGQDPGPVPVKVRTWAERVKLRENWHVQCTGVQGYTGSHTLTLIRSTWRHRESDIGDIGDIMEPAGAVTRRQWESEMRVILISRQRNWFTTSLCICICTVRVSAHLLSAYFTHLWCDVDWSEKCRVACSKHAPPSSPHALIHPWNKINPSRAPGLDHGLLSGICTSVPHYFLCTDLAWPQSIMIYIWYVSNPHSTRNSFLT